MHAKTFFQRNVILAAMAIAAMGASAPAFAAGSEVVIAGSVAAKCAYTSTSQTISLGELADATTGLLNPAALNGKSATLAGYCNGLNSTITVAAGGMENKSLPTGAKIPSGFGGVVGYTATATAGSVTNSDYSNDATNPTAKALGLYAGNITLTLSNATLVGGSAVLVAGNYQGGTTVTLTPAI